MLKPARLTPTDRLISVCTWAVVILLLPVLVPIAIFGHFAGGLHRRDRHG